MTELEHDKIIIGIDPGTNVMGYGILGIKGKTPSLIAMGAVSYTHLTLPTNSRV